MSRARRPRPFICFLPSKRRPKHERPFKKSVQNLELLQEKRKEKKRKLDRQRLAEGVEWNGVECVKAHYHKLRVANAVYSRFVYVYLFCTCEVVGKR